MWEPLRASWIVVPARRSGARTEAATMSHEQLHDPVTTCGCAAVHGENGERQALAVDAGIKDRNIKRLRRIEGQIRGLQRMVDDERYCADIMIQIASVQEALRAVGRELMRNHLKHCGTAAIRGGDEQAEAMYDEIIDLMYRNVR
jgi:CsoR family transcriptional regulator, copper-sensing transcriptional repressor